MAQHDEILSYIQYRGAITPFEAMELCGSMRLAARINELRRAGHNIHAEMVTAPSGRRFARYTIEEQRDLPKDA